MKQNRPAYRVLAVLGAVILLSGFSCFDQTSNCDVIPVGDPQLIGVTHRRPDRCPVVLSAPLDVSYLANVETNSEHVGDILWTRFTNATGGQILQRFDFFALANPQYGTRAAQVGGSYRAATAGCVFGGAFQEDRAESTASANAWWAQNAGAIVRLTYNLARCGSVSAPNGAPPYTPVTASATPPTDPTWVGATTYEWSVNGQSIGAYGSSASWSFGPTEPYAFEVTMRDAAGHTAIRSAYGMTSNAGVCSDPAAIYC